MIGDFLCLVDEEFGISSSLENCEDYLVLTDAILNEVERSKKCEQAQKIIKRLRMRNLYSFVAQHKFKSSVHKIITEKDVARFAPEGSRLKNSRNPGIKLRKYSFNYGMQDRNPIDSVRFYNSKDENNSFFVSKDEVSELLPNVFNETILQLYVVHPEDFQDAEIAFKRCIKEFL